MERECKNLEFRGEVNQGSDFNPLCAHRSFTFTKMLRICFGKTKRIYFGKAKT
jgi:hypothetical protein